MIELNGGWDNSVEEIKEALDTLSYWLRKGATIGIFNKETGKWEMLKPFDSENTFVLGAMTL